MILSWISLNPGPVSKLIIMRNRSPSTYLSHYGWVGFFCLFVTHNKHNRGRGRAPGERIGYPPQYSWVSLVAQSKESTHNAGDLGSILGLGRFPGGGHCNPLQSSCLENPMDRGAWQTQSMGLQRIRHD